MLRKVLWWVNVLLGLWIAAAPWVLGYQTIEPAFYNGIIAGLAVAVIAFVGWLAEQGVFGGAHASTTKVGEARNLRAA
jgi:hypothetical protein